MKKILKPLGNTKGVFVNNKLTIDEIKAIDDIQNKNLLLAKYKDGTEAIIDGYGLVCDNHFKMKDRFSDFYKKIPKIKGIIKEALPGKVNVGDIIFKDGKLIKIDNEDELKELGLEMNSDIFGDGSCVFYAPLKSNLNELNGNELILMDPNNRCSIKDGYFECSLDDYVLKISLWTVF